jgi:polysaccharide biosynthesis protein PslH
VGDELRERCRLVEEFVPYGRGQRWPARLRQRAGIALSPIGGVPSWVTHRAMPAFQARVRELARTWRPHVVQLEYHVMGQYLSALEGCPAPRVLNQYEPGARAASEVWERSAGVARIRAYLDLLAWQQYERRVVRRVNAIVVFTAQDRQVMESYVAHPPIVTIPFGTVLPLQALSPVGTPPPSVLFVGNFRHPPNVDAAVRLARGIFPRVRQRYPEAMLYVVGAHPPAALRDAAGPNVVITGYVPDLNPHLDRAAVVVAPLRHGGGMRVKVLEALAAGKAVVASPLAATGISVSDGVQLVLAETDQQFSQQILRLLDAPRERAALAARARRWARAELDWKRPIEAYEALYHDLVTQREVRPAEDSH